MPIIGRITIGVVGIGGCVALTRISVAYPARGIEDAEGLGATGSGRLGSLFLIGLSKTGAANAIGQSVTRTVLCVDSDGAG